MIQLKDKAQKQIEKLGFIKNLNSLVLAGKKQIHIKYLTGSLKSFMAGALWHSNDKNLLIFTSDDNIISNWKTDLQLFVKNHLIGAFTDIKPHFNLQDDELSEGSVQLIESLNILQKEEKFVAIVKPDLLLKSLPKPKDISNNRLRIKKNSVMDRNEFCRTLALNGFSRSEFVAGQGEFAVRGAIVDIFPIGWDNPIRIEFFGNEIESLREFNLLAQRSIRSHDEVEFIAHVFHNKELHTEGNFLDYIPENTIVILDEPEALKIKFPEISIPDKYPTIFINGLGNADITVKSSPQPNYHSSVRTFCEEINKLSYYNANIIISAESKYHLNRMYDIAENTLELIREDSSSDNDIISRKQLDSIIWLEQSLTAGFILDDYSLCVFTEHEIFDRLRVQDKKGKKASGGISVKELKKLHIGDFVVHVDKGIGKFDGFERVTIGGSEQDCVRLLFADDDKLYVHLNYLYKVQKYSAQEGVVPKLSKLGSADWLRKKEKTKRRLKDIARELITIYAQRKMNKGFAFSQDTVWQKELEASFMFEDTADQARSTAEVKKDMESDIPMDRLICGDVGFGKTEVAVRAAFKAVQNGKQVAVLVPTTILSQQHLMTFSDRLSNYPVLVDSLSRFKNSSEQKQVIEKIKEGKLDILIGTHRILSKDVKFKDLGLLIIDEEHRFGVGAKEKLREFRSSVDTLTLTATPIPRTLNFSLMGARDLSVIETPPRNRIPIITEILEWNDKVIVESIENEINRGGQVFFVNDKIEDIDIIMKKLQMLMPRLRFGVAHGQMKASELESVMEKFIKGRFDVLITTKIVESGLDIPNANTMIINRSHKFGLAELYQLKGRVGRSNIQAFCYLMIPQAKGLSPSSLRRLQAIEEFSDLGSGFQLAMRDLEIRGAGNLLGPEQSGYINEIGFEMFHKILDEAVNELRTQEFSEVFKDRIDLQRKYLENNDLAIVMNTDALLPSDFIVNDSERFAYYKKLYNVKSNQELQQLADEIKDRFGNLPFQARELLFAVKLRLAALNTGFIKLLLHKSKLISEFPPDTNTEYYEKALPLLLDFLPELNNTKLVQHDDKLTLEISLENRDEAIEILWRIKKLFESLDS